MTPELWEEVQSLFAGALELGRNQWEGFVRSQASDPAVAEEVLALLDAHGQEGLFDDLTGEDPLDELPGDGLGLLTRVGPWEIQGEIGRGGMGAVYLVRRADGQFEQQAALKILPAHIRERDGEARFLAERRILARLHHPFIARLLDGGVSEDGLPYFVLEHVRGLPIHQYCREWRLDVAGILRLFMKVCRAVQYAHQNLIVHRDLKPSNILITDDGEPRLLDFGIAKLLDDSLTGRALELTRAGTRPLTPAYAAPEQMEGVGVTTATDVYQLGVLLYELLVGSRPAFEGGKLTGAPGEATTRSGPLRPSRAVLSPVPPATEDSPRASAQRLPEGDWKRLAWRLRGDLDGIVLKALRPEPDRRYGTAGELADDLARYLEGRPVRARPDTLVYRSTKFVRRNSLSLGAALGAFLLVAGFGFGMRRQAQETALERDRGEAVIRFLVELFQSSDPSVARGDTLTVRQVLDVGTDRVRSELTGQPEVQATLQEVLGEVYGNLGLYDPGAALLEEAYAARRNLPDSRPADVAQTLRRLAMLSAKAGRFEEADTLLPQALDLTLASLDPGSPEYARAVNDLGFTWQILGRLDRAEPLLEEALGIWGAEGFTGTQGAAALLNLGWLRRSMNDPDSAESLFRRALTLRQQEGEEGDLGRAAVLEALVRIAQDRGDLETADNLLSEALTIRRQWLPEGHPGTLALLAQQGNILRSRGFSAEAEALLREVLGARIAALGETHFLVAESRNDLALALQEVGRLREAAEEFRGAWDGYRRQFGENHPNAAVVETNLARVLFRLSENQEAEARFAHALPITRAAFPGARWVLGDQVSLGLLRCSPPQLPGALSDLRGARDALRPREGNPAPEDYLRAANALGSCLALQGEWEEAIEALRESLAASADRSDQDPYRAFALEILAQLEGAGH